MEIPETSYATSGEIKIAYKVFGAGEHDLLFSLVAALGAPAAQMLDAFM